ncbi:MAG: hypothetical protein ACI83P_002270 [Janthinobacterium sp.]|jgi:hypothetical protein
MQRGRGAKIMLPDGGDRLSRHPPTQEGIAAAALAQHIWPTCRINADLSYDGVHAPALPLPARHHASSFQVIFHATAIFH